MIYRFIQEVESELRQQVSNLPTKAIAIPALVNNSYVIKTETLEEALSVSDKIGPEHLQLHIKDAFLYKSKPKHYGGLFLGHVSAEVLGDYCAGPNHVLPTRGTARYSGGLSVFTFLRVRTWLDISAANQEAHKLVTDCSVLGELEGLIGHSNAAKQRLALTLPTHSLDDNVQPNDANESEILRRYVKAEFSSLPPYTPIKPLEVVAAEVGLSVSQLVKLDANENTYGPVPQIKEAIATYAHNNIYPDPGQAELRQAIANAFHLSPKQVVAGTGADDLLQLFVSLTQGNIFK